MPIFLLVLVVLVLIGFIVFASSIEMKEQEKVVLFEKKPYMFDAVSELNLYRILMEVV